MKKPLPLLFFAFTLIIQACSSSNVTATATVSPPVTATEAQVVTAVPAPTETVIPVSPSAVPITHTNIPTKGIGDRLTSHDNDNALSYQNKTVRSGDEFFKNRFERPFTANDMQYLPALDIVNFSVTSGDTFFYFKLSFVSLDAATQSLNGSYGLEIDRNADGRAELLVATKPPYTADFTANNVTVYMDMNGDVGGTKINRPDTSPSDGFETVIFDLGKDVYPKDDPDFAWVRQTTDGSLPAVEIAIPRWIFKDGKESFMWSADSSGSPLDPALFYYQDHFTAEQAGAANKDDPNYPIKALAQVDNTCRVPFGFDAMGTEPFGCYVQVAEKEVQGTPSAEGPASTCAQFVDLCARVKDSSIPYSP